MLKVNNIGKSINTYPSEWHRIKKWFFSTSKTEKKKWLLRNISFELEKGESIGILGLNGAGKSTLLKIIAGVIPPTEGIIHCYGRIHAILELGMGFNQELNGVSNAFHSLGCMGFNSKEIEKIIPRVKEFSELGDYFEQPIRIYSTGMMMRLAFSISTAVRPDILIIDEAMAVGDAAFQRKCFVRIKDFRNKGTSLILVSHEIEAIKKHCDKALLLENSILEAIGPTDKICKIYEKKLFGVKGDKPKTPTLYDKITHQNSETLFIEKEYGSGKVKISSIQIKNKQQDVINAIHTGDSFFIEYSVLFLSLIKNVNFGLSITSVDGLVLYADNTDNCCSKSLQNKAFMPKDSVIISFKLICNLSPGNYFLNIGVVGESNSQRELLQRLVDTSIIEVRSSKRKYIPSGLVNMFARSKVVYSKNTKRSLSA